MVRKTSKHKKAAMAYNLVYEFPGKLLTGWEAELVDDDTYVLHRVNGSSRVIKLYEKISTFKGDSMVSKSEHGTLNIGEHSVLIGKGLKHGFHARALKKPMAFLLMSPGNKNLGTVEVGKSFAGSNVELIAPHLIRVGEDVYPIAPKKHEIKLLIYKTPHENGYMAYINFLEPGNPRNGEDGAPGTFVPPTSDQDPGMFYEEFSGQKVLTAQFWLEKGGERVTFHSRDGAVALKEKQLERKLQQAKDVALSVDIDPMEFHEYKQIHDELKDIRGQWVESSMRVQDGAEIFKPHDIRRVIQSGLEM